MAYTIAITGHGVPETTVRRVFEGAIRTLRDATRKNGTPPSGHASGGSDLLLIVSADDVDRPKEEPDVAGDQAAAEDTPPPV